MFQFRQLQCFVAIAAELHFGRAAARLNMTQPPLSRQMQLLEHELGVKLVDRGPHAVRLTPAGHAFLPEAKRLLEVAHTARLTAWRAMQGESGSLVLGYVAGAAFNVLPRIVAAAAAELPDVELVLRDMTSSEQIDALRTGRIDVGLIRPPVAAGGLEALTLVREPFIAALREDHRLAARERLQVTDLHDENMVMYEPGQGGRMYELLSSVFHAAGVTPRYVQYVRQTYCILGLVTSGVGVALLQQSADVLAMAQTVFRPIDLPAHAVSEIQLAWRAEDANEKPVVRRFTELVQATIFG